MSCSTVGTGGGKTVAFTLALSMDEEPIASPILLLSSLMVEQMENASISTIAVCKDRYESMDVKRAKTRKGRLEEAYLTLYANTPACLRKVSDKCFNNNKKVNDWLFHRTIYSSP